MRTTDLLPSKLKLLLGGGLLALGCQSADWAPADDTEAAHIHQALGEDGGSGSDEICVFLPLTDGGVLHAPLDVLIASGAPIPGVVPGASSGIEGARDDLAFQAPCSSTVAPPPPDGGQSSPAPEAEIVVAVVEGGTATCLVQESCATSCSSTQSCNLCPVRCVGTGCRAGLCEALLTPPPPPEDGGQSSPVPEAEIVVAVLEGGTATCLVQESCATSCSSTQSCKLCPVRCVGTGCHAGLCEALFREPTGETQPAPSEDGDSADAGS